MEMDSQDLETDEAPINHNETSVISSSYIPTGYASKDLLSSPENLRLIQQPQSEEQCVYRPCLNSPKSSYSTVVGGNNTRTSATSKGIRHYVPEFPETLVNNNVSTRINSNNSQSHEQSTSHSNSGSVSEEKLDINNCGVSFDRPKHPSLAIPVARLKTLKNWPKQHLLTPEELCEAGFFYCGREDTTVCFYCNQGLNAWEAGDRPWTEHARWSPHCTHVLNIKGPEFVQQVLKFADNPEKLREIDDRYKQNESPQTSTKPRSNHRFETDSCSPVENPVDTLFDRPAAQSVLTVINDEKLVKSAIHYVVKKEGTGFSFTAVELMEVVLDIQDGKIKIPETSAEANQRDLNTDCGDLENDKTVAGANAILTENRSLKEQMRCKVCLDKKVCIVFLPCGHLCTCADCAPALRDCPVCRKFVRGTVKTYMA